MSLTMTEFGVLAMAKGSLINHADAPAECERLAELGLIKATFGGYRITFSGQERLALGP